MKSKTILDIIGAMHDQILHDAYTYYPDVWVMSSNYLEQAMKIGWFKDNFKPYNDAKGE